MDKANETFVLPSSKKLKGSVRQAKIPLKADADYPVPLSDQTRLFNVWWKLILPRCRVIFTVGGLAVHAASVKMIATI